MFKQLFAVAICILLLNSTTAQTGKTAVQYYNEGVKLQDEDKFTEALAAYKNALAKNPNYKEALYGAGWTNNELKKYSDALPLLQKAKGLWPNEAKVYRELGYAYSKLGKNADAIQNLTRCLSINPEESLAYKYLAVLYYDTKDYEKSLKNIKSFLENDPETKDDDIYYRKGVAENELELFDDALVSLEKADELNPNNVKFLNEIGYSYYSLKNADEALRYYRKSLLNDPKSLTALNGVANVYRKLKKDPKEGIKLFAKTLEIAPKNINANYWTAWCYNELEKYNDAIPYLKKVLEVDDQYVSAYTELGYCDYALKNYDEALVNFKKAFAIEKTELNVYYTGLCYVGKKDKQSALKMLSDLKAMNSQHVKDLQDSIDKM